MVTLLLSTGVMVAAECSLCRLSWHTEFLLIRDFNSTEAFNSTGFRMPTENAQTLHTRDLCVHSAFLGKLEDKSVYIGP